MAFRVIIPGTGMVLGVFDSEHKAIGCQREHYSTATDLCPIVEPC